MSDDTATRTAVQRYIDRGWSVIPLYGVREDDSCMCVPPGGACWAGASSIGKHPMGVDGRGNRWGDSALPSPDDLPPGANIGLATGLASHVWALDVDPKNGGDARLAELVAEHGPLPATWAQKTGSGGQHYVFALPEDFTPTNSRGRLPVGLDVRGQGGQIVLAPSVSGVGPYEEMGGEPVQAPAWLLDLIRPLPPITVPVGMEQAWMPQAPTDRGQAYATAAVREELARLERSAPGERNATAFRVACRLIELAHSPWSGLTEDMAAAEYAAFGQAITGPDFTAGELWACWRSAARKIGYGSAVLPPPPGGQPAFLEWGALGGPPVMPPFSPAGSPPAPEDPLRVTGAADPGGQPLNESTGAVPFDPFADAGVGSPAPVYAPYAQPVQPPVDYYATGQSAPQQQSTPHLRDFLLRRSELSRLPRPVPLIQGVLWRDTDAWLIGASGSGKSFVALDWAAHVASGRPWNNRRVWQGAVIWVVGEGTSGIQQRVDAWELAYGAIGDQLIVLPVAVQAALRSGRALGLSPAWRQLMEIGAEIRPAMIVLDTQARMTRGLNENDNDEMGQWVEAVSILRRASGTPCNLVVHHTGRNGGDARGASSIDGAQDVEWKVERVGSRADMRGRIVLEKSKDGADGTAYPFALQVHRLGWNPEAEEHVTSLTVSYDPFDQPGGERGMDYGRDLNARQMELALLIAEVGEPQGDTLAQLTEKVRLWVAQRLAGHMPTRLTDAAGKPVDKTTVRRLLLEQGEKGDGLVGRGTVKLIAGASPKYADPERFERYEAGEFESD